MGSVLPRLFYFSRTAVSRCPLGVFRFHNSFVRERNCGLHLADQHCRTGQKTTVFADGSFHASAPEPEWAIPDNSIPEASLLYTVSFTAPVRPNFERTAIRFESSLNSRTSSKIPYRSHNFPLDVETGQSTLHVRVFSCVQEIEIQYGHGSLEREGNFGVSPYLYRWLAWRFFKSPTYVKPDQHLLSWTPIISVLFLTRVTFYQFFTVET